jgi:hypothetical protein
MFNFQDPLRLSTGRKSTILTAVLLQVWFRMSYQVKHTAVCGDGGKKHFLNAFLALLPFPLSVITQNQQSTNSCGSWLGTCKCDGTSNSRDNKCTMRTGDNLQVSACNEWWDILRGLTQTLQCWDCLQISYECILCDINISYNFCHRNALSMLNPRFSQR